MATPTPTSAPTDTPIPPTAVPPSPTPLPPVISVDTIGRLSIASTFGQGEHSRSVVFSPDSALLASAAGNTVDFAIRLWEVPSGQALRTLEGHSNIVWGLAFSPLGSMLASASKDATVKVWDWQSGSLLHALNFPNEVTSVLFSPDGQTLAAGGVEEWPNAAIWTYSVASWAPLMKLAEYWNIGDMAYSPDGQLLAGGGTSRNVRMWRTSDGAELSILYHAGQVSSMAISPDGSLLATGSCEASVNYECTRGAIWLWDLPSGTLLKRLSGFPSMVQGVAFSLDGSLVMAGSRDGTLRAYATLDYQRVLDSYSPGRIFTLAVSPDGRYLATGRTDGKVDLWSIGP